MTAILILGLIMVVLAVYLWWIELQDFVNRMVFVKRDDTGWMAVPRHLLMSFRNVLLFIRYGIPVLIDVSLTLFFTSQLGLAGGVTGGVMGLALSNGISIIIISSTRKRRRQICHE